MQGSRSLLAVISGITAFFLANPALALEMSYPDGWYIEGNVGVARISGMDANSGTVVLESGSALGPVRSVIGPVSLTNKTGPAYNINIGYKFMPYVALEAGYTRFKDNKLVANDISVSFPGLLPPDALLTNVTVANVSHYSFDIAAKGILPICDMGIELFAKLGAALMRARASTTTITVNDVVVIASDEFSRSNSTTNLYLGLGAQFNILPELGIVVQWQRTQGNSGTGAGDLYSVGLNFIAV